MRKLAQVIGFQPKENAKDIFIKKYQDGYVIEIDFHREIINYGDKIICESKTTQNFSQAENFVVLECVNRLLEKRQIVLNKVSSQQQDNKQPVKVTGKVVDESGETLPGVTVMIEGIS